MKRFRTAEDLLAYYASNIGFLQGMLVADQFGDRIDETMMGLAQDISTYRLIEEGASEAFIKTRCLQLEHRLNKFM